MTRKKFINILLQALGYFANAPEETAEVKKFQGMKAGIFYGLDEDGKGESDHYILLELKDGSTWRLYPERVLKKEEHEEKLWKEFDDYMEKMKEEEPDEPDIT